MILILTFLILTATIPSGSTPTSSNLRDSEFLNNSTIPNTNNTSPCSAPQTRPDNSMTTPPYSRASASPRPVIHSQSNTGSSSSSSSYQAPEESIIDVATPPYGGSHVSPPSLAEPYAPSSVSENNTSPSTSVNSRQPRRRNFMIRLCSGSPFPESNSNGRLPVFQRRAQLTRRAPWYRRNPFYAIERATNPLPPNEWHRVDRLSQCVLSYFLAWGMSYGSERPNVNTSLYIQAFLNQAAFALFILANAVFPRTHPALAFIIDRLSFVLVVISAYLASLPMLPPYVAIAMFVVVAIVYLFAHLRG